VIQGPASLPEPARLQRAHGCGRIAVKLDGRTRLARLYQEGCAKIRAPRDAEARGLQAVLINTAGGLTGGDRMRWEIEAGAGAELTMTTQACERIYRAADGQAEVAVALAAGDGARLAWLPQETILFDEGALSRRLDVELGAGASLLVVEAVILGRTAMGETVRHGLLRDRWRVRQAGRLIFADDLKLAGAIAATAEAQPILGGARAFASILLVDADPTRFLGPVRAALGASGGASAFDGKLFARVAAPDGLALRHALIPALQALRDGAALPRVWRL
jgi:urease accessory protein